LDGLGASCWGQNLVSTGAKQGGGSNQNFSGVSQSSDVIQKGSLLGSIEPQAIQVQWRSGIHGVAAVLEIQRFVFFPRNLKIRAK
jgi:hypothetical protein